MTSVILWALLSVGVAAAAPLAQAGTTGTTPTTVATTLQTLPPGAGHIIKPPNYGHKPTSPGDRGGWEQTALFWLVLAALAVIVLLAWRQSKRARASR